MKKYVLKATGKEMRIGELVQVIMPYDEIGTVILQYPITEESIPKLLELDILEEKNNEPILTVEMVIDHLSERIKWRRDNLEKYLDNLYKIYPSALFSILLREIAIMFDEKYPDHISNSKEIWAVGFLNGKVYRVLYPEGIKSFNTFAAFRSQKEALSALGVLEGLASDLWKIRK